MKYSREKFKGTVMNRIDDGSLKIASTVSLIKKNLCFNFQFIILSSCGE